MRHLVDQSSTRHSDQLKFSLQRHRHLQGVYCLIAQYTCRCLSRNRKRKRIFCSSVVLENHAQAIFHRRDVQAIGTLSYESDPTEKSHLRSQVRTHIRSHVISHAKISCEILVRELLKSLLYDKKSVSGN